jgi:Trm5-related predicted tRNA methylase
VLPVVLSLRLDNIGQYQRKNRATEIFLRLVFQVSGLIKAVATVSAPAEAKPSVLSLALALILILR